LEGVACNSISERPLTNKRFVPFVAQNTIHFAPVASLVAARNITLTGDFPPIAGGQKMATSPATAKRTRRMPHFVFMRVTMPNDPIPQSRETRPTRAFDCNLDAMAGFAAAHG